MLAPLKKIYENLDHILKRRDIALLTKAHLVKTMVFSSSHVWMWDLSHKEGWALKSWRFWTAVLEKTLESPLDRNEIKPVHLKGDQSWVFIGRTIQEMVKDREAWLLQSMGLQRVIHDWATEQQKDWMCNGEGWDSDLFNGFPLYQSLADSSHFRIHWMGDGG